jgi:predicted ABC-type ATPase
MLEMIDELAERGESFAFETTLSGRTYLAKIRLWRSLGYQVSIYYLRLPNAEIALDRIRRRVVEGGHDVPEAVVRRRFEAGWRNLRDGYQQQADSLVIYDASGPVPIIVEESRNVKESR